MNYDLMIVGAGPAGLSMALCLADSGLKIAIVEKQALSAIKNPEYDGREIALTHDSKKHLSKLKIWSNFAQDELHRIEQAKVLTGDSSQSLNFDKLPQNTQELGYIISNHTIRQRLYDAVKELPNVELLTQTSIVSFSADDNCAYLNTENDEEFKTKLVISADSRFSKLRGQMGIPVKYKDFARTAIVFKTKHQDSHQHKAIEFFNYGHTLAILPLSEQESSIVITVDSDKAAQFKNMTDDQLAQFVDKTTKPYLGKTISVSKRFSYPLVGAISDKFINKRCAVIGDAAVGMHPVTAHGYNLGLQSAVLLSQQIKKSIRLNKDFGLASNMMGYQAEHGKNSLIMYQGTNLIVKLFTNESEPGKLARKVVLGVSEQLAPLKYFITRKLTHS